MFTAIPPSPAPTLSVFLCESTTAHPNFAIHLYSCLSLGAICSLYHSGGGHLWVGLVSMFIACPTYLLSSKLFFFSDRGSVYIGNTHPRSGVKSIYSSICCRTPSDVNSKRAEIFIYFLFIAVSPETRTLMYPL